ncbi:uncharacterized protein LOC114517345 [Dendronephthya gigantea]|uniref:uncharacterized protein LOC114517345 n=1 Tax=Dendronephthya gigantea TaxID=151771 RepID=UPI00106C8F24|nr:uncharacterized protein LOC114517345 [Dendronephthya gigantea]
MSQIVNFFNINVPILKMISIGFKPVQSLLLVTGVGLVSYFTREYRFELSKGNPQPDPYDIGKLGRYEFYLYTASVGIIISGLALVCILRGLLEKKYGATSMAIVQALWASQLMISTALLFKVLTTYQETTASGTPYCEYWNKLPEREYHHTCGQLIGGVVCGIFALALFALDSIISMIFVLKSEA